MSHQIVACPCTVLAASCNDIYMYCIGRGCEASWLVKAHIVCSVAECPLLSSICKVENHVTRLLATLATQAVVYGRL